MAFCKPLGLMTAALFGGLMLATAPAQADSTEQRLKRLEADVQGLSRLLLEGQGTAPRGGAAAPAVGANAAVADMQVRLSRLEQQLMVLSGQIEKLAFENRQLASRLARQSDDNEFRMQAIEDRLNGGAGTGMAATAGDGGSVRPGSAPTQPASGQPSGPKPQQAITLPSGAPSDQYAFALRLLRDGNYEGAGSAFEQFLKAHPKDKLAGNAQYWLGESHYARTQYREAAAAFLVGVQKYKRSPKAPDNMLKLGMTMRRLGHLEQACLTLDELPRRFPKATAATKKTAKDEIALIGCGDYLN